MPRPTGYTPKWRARGLAGGAIARTGCAAARQRRKAVPGPGEGGGGSERLSSRENFIWKACFQYVASSFPQPSSGCDEEAFFFNALCEI